MTRRDKDNDVSAGGLNEQWLLPKLENSTEPTLDVDKKTDYIQLKPQLHFDWKFQNNNLVRFDILVDPLICNWSSDWYRMSRYRSGLISKSGTNELLKHLVVAPEKITGCTALPTVSFLSSTLPYWSALCGPCLSRPHLTYYCSIPDITPTPLWPKIRKPEMDAGGPTWTLGGEMMWGCLRRASLNTGGSTYPTLSCAAQDRLWIVDITSRHVTLLLFSRVIARVSLPPHGVISSEVQCTWCILDFGRWFVSNQQ